MPLPFQCVSTLAFVKNEVEVLDSPIWIMIVNIVALEMLGDTMPKLGSGGKTVVMVIEIMAAMRMSTMTRMRVTTIMVKTMTIMISYYLLVFRPQEGEGGSGWVV